MMLCIAVTVSGAWAQTLTVDTAMRGNTLVADPGLAGAWWNNPAGLANLVGVKSDSDAYHGWHQAASVAGEFSGNTDAFAVNWAGNEAGHSYGLGAGYQHQQGGNVWGMGFGKAWPKEDISWGVNYHHFEAQGGGGSHNIFDVGILGRLPAPSIEGVSAIRYGVVVRDVGAAIKRLCDVGVAADLPWGLHFAMDLADVSNALGRRFRIGVTKELGTTPALRVGLGLDQGDLTLGAIYAPTTKWEGATWNAGVAWQQMKGQLGAANAVLVGASGTWGF